MNSDLICLDKKWVIFFFKERPKPSWLETVLGEMNIKGVHQIVIFFSEVKNET